MNAAVPAAPSAGDGSQSNDVGDDIGDSFRIGVRRRHASVVLGAMTPFGVRRRRAAAQDREELDRGDARGELLALGEEIEALTWTSRCRTRAHAAATRMNRHSSLRPR